MKKGSWKNKIKKASIAAGTYKDCFDDIIDTLAGILEQRDEARIVYKKGGEEILIPHINKAGNLYYEQNPALRLMNDLNRDALAYWRDLGLTPAGLKRIDESAVKISGNIETFESILSGLGI